MENNYTVCVETISCMDTLDLWVSQQLLRIEFPDHATKLALTDANDCSDAQCSALSSNLHFQFCDAFGLHLHDFLRLPPID